MTEKWKDKLTDQLCLALLSLKTEDEVYCFLEDVATIGEIRALAQRLEVARLLSEAYTYPQIAQQRVQAPLKISRVKKFLEYGATGYKIVLDRLKETEDTPRFPKRTLPAPERLFIWSLIALREPNGVAPSTYYWAEGQRFSRFKGHCAHSGFRARHNPLPCSIIFT